MGFDTPATAAARESRRVELDDEFHTVGSDLQKLQLSADDVDNLSTAHRMLSQIFNLFTPKLYYAGGVAQEFLENAKTGISSTALFPLA